MPLKVRLDAALIALGLDPSDVDWHHEPPLELRPYDEETGTWRPDANDPRHIIPMKRSEHRERTPADLKAIRKTNRIAEKRQRHLQKLSEKLRR